MGEITTRTIGLVPDPPVEELTIEQQIAAEGDTSQQPGEVVEFPEPQAEVVPEPKLASFERSQPYIDVLGNGISIEGAMKLYADLGEALTLATA